MSQANIDGAAEIFARVLTLYPQRARALDGMGEVLRARKNYVQSIRYFDQALRAENTDIAEVLTHRGYAKILVGDLPGAKEDLRVALAAKPSPETWLRLAELQTRQGDKAAALKSLLNIMDTPQAYNQIGTVLMKMSAYRAAADCFSQAITANPAWYEEAHRNLALANEYLQRSAG